MQKLLSICQKINFLFLLGLLIFIPLYPKFPLFNVPKTYVAIRLEDIFIGAVTIFWLVSNIGNLKKYLQWIIFQAIVLFWLIGGLSLISALFITFSIEPHLGFLHWLRRIEYMILFMIAATTITSYDRLKVMIITSLVVLAAVVSYGFGQIWFNFPVVSTTNKEFSKGLILYLTEGARVNSTFAGHYDLAVYLSLMVMFVAAVILYLQPFIKKICLGLLGFLSLVLLGFTASRISFITTFLGLSLIFWLQKQKMFLLGLILVAGTIIVLIPDLRHRIVATVTVNLLQGGGPKYTPAEDRITVFTNLSSYPESSRAALLEQAIRESTSSTRSGAIAVDTAPGEPINTTELGVYRSWGIRLNVEWPRAINAFYKNPFLGTGYSSLTIATDNDYLRSLGEVGILGTLSLGLVFFILIKKMSIFLKQSQGLERYFTLASFACIIVILSSALFIDVLEASKVAEIFWLLIGSAWAVMMNYQKK